MNDAVRAIIIYPMNALANDQIKRLQKLLKDHPTIRFGLYNGNTEQTKDRALAEYQRVNGRNAVQYAVERAIQDSGFSR